MSALYAGKVHMRASGLLERWKKTRPSSPTSYQSRGRLHNIMEMALWLVYCRGEATHYPVRIAHSILEKPTRAVSSWQTPTCSPLGNIHHLLRSALADEKGR